MVKLASNRRGAWSKGDGLWSVDKRMIVGGLGLGQDLDGHIGGYSSSTFESHFPIRQSFEQKERKRTRNLPDAGRVVSSPAGQKE